MWVRDFGFANLAPTESVPILEQERFEGRLLTTPNGETVIDFGQNLAGYTELRLTARAGQKITLWHGETLDENGNFTQKNFDPGTGTKTAASPSGWTISAKTGRTSGSPASRSSASATPKWRPTSDLTDAAVSPPSPSIPGCPRPAFSSAATPT